MNFYNNYFNLLPVLSKFLIWRGPVKKNTTIVHSKNMTHTFILFNLPDNLDIIFYNTRLRYWNFQ